METVTVHRYGFLFTFAQQADLFIVRPASTVASN